ncbi:MAG: porin family protein [Gammaproteobacteria bacterium]|nr:porin family protein [Gammaproteobacteria bacterium]NND55224.1 porin family protein [Gammaproteobacteria bacterium]
MKALTALAMTALLFPALASAVDSLNYRYSELSYTSGDLDAPGGDIDADAISLFGSYAINDKLAVTAGISSGEIETGELALIGDDTDTKGISFGLVPHYPLSDKTDVLMPVAIQWSEAEVGSVKEDDIGFSIGAGVRSLVTELIELEAGVDYVDVGDESDTVVSGSVRLHATDTLSIAVGGSHADDVDSYFVRGRVAF